MFREDPRQLQQQLHPNWAIINLPQNTGQVSRDFTALSGSRPGPQPTERELFLAHLQLTSPKPGSSSASSSTGGQLVSPAVAAALKLCTGAAANWGRLVEADAGAGMAVGPWYRSSSPQAVPASHSDSEPSSMLAVQISSVTNLTLQTSQMQAVRMQAVRRRRSSSSLGCSMVLPQQGLLQQVWGQQQQGILPSTLLLLLLRVVVCWLGLMW